MRVGTTRYLRRLAALCVMASALAACTTAEFQAMFPPEQPKKKAASDAPRRSNAAGEGQNGPARTVALVRPPTPRPEPSTTPPLKLIGLTRSEAEALLGVPAAEAERSPAKVWQYRAEDCTVDVYFYLDVARNEFYALHYEARGPQAAAGGTAVVGRSEAADRCLRRIHDANRTR